MGNTALTGQVTASNYIAPFEAARAVDGISKPVNRWVGEVPCTLSFIPNNLYVVNRWVVNGMASVGWDPQQYYLLTYSLQGSNDNTTWFTLDIVDNTNTSTISYSSDRTFIPTAAYRYYRVNVTRGLKCNPNIASISNFQLFPVDPSSPFLSSLTINSGTLTPAFVKTTYNYTATVDYGVTSIVVTPTAETPTAYGQNAIIKVNGVVTGSGTGTPVNLAVGNNTIYIDVYSAVGGLIQRYTLTVTRSNSNKLTSLSVLNGTTVLPMTPNFDKNTFVGYTVEVDSTVQSVMINATCENPASTMTINGGAAVSGTPYGPIPLQTTGDTTVNVIVSTANMSPQTYTVTIKRKEDLSLSNLVIANLSALTLTPPFNSNTFSYIASSGKVTSLKVQPTANKPADVIIKVNGVDTASGVKAIVTVTPGETNKIEISVTSKTSGNFVTYVCNVTVSN